ncbi:MAG: UvrD-helicase domain-containing protein [Erysipelotrichaceae bacterium]|nr:UvrD-helicase domain-containing protein [Erysipelotrichaceae bacterium]
MTNIEKMNPYLKAQAIRNHNVLVSASAGAGKTTNLIERLLLRIQNDRIPVTQIIAVTFAKDAAAELKEKLEKRLSDLYHKTKDEFIYEQLSLLPQAQITTIHSFCLDMVRSYSYVLGLDPACAENILDETMKSEMMELAFGEALAHYPQTHTKGLEELLAHFSSRPESTESLKTSVYSLSDKLKTLNDPKAWIDKSLQALKTKKSDELSAELKSWLHVYYRWAIDDLLFLCESNLLRMSEEKAYYALCEEADQMLVDGIQFGLTDLIEALKVLLLEMNDFNYTKFRNSVLQLPKNGFSSLPKAQNHPEYDKSMKKMVGAYREILSTLFEEEDWFKDHEELYLRSESLAKLTLDFMDAYQKLKEKEKVIDFDDMEHFALDILRNKNFEVALDYQKKYIDILVDEYQDTNAIQDSIISLIAREDNVFRVGDVKQSIYRFRNAQPELMAGRKKVQDDQNEVLFYDKNFRSSLPIVEFNNLLFKRLMNQDHLKASYDDLDWVSIGRKEQEPKVGDGVEFHLLIDNEPEVLEIKEDENVSLNSSEEVSEDNTSDDEVDNGLDEKIIELHPEDLNGAQSKAIYIANLIQDLRKNSDFKKYSDYTILVRTNGIKAILKEIFDQANIPNSISVKTGFFSSDAVQDVLLVIKFIIDPHDSINFIGLCLSDFVQMTEEHVANLKLHKDRITNFYEALETAFPSKYALLKKFREDVSGKNLVEIFRAIYGFNHYYDEHCTKQQRANLDLLFEKAQVFAKDNLALAEFLTLIKNIKDEESSEAIPYTKKDDVVKVMTIHQSKGLQFPVVIYWSADKAKTKDKDNEVLLDSDLGFALKTVKLPKRYTRKSPYRIAMEMKAIQDDVEEQVRLLYVALTRAESRLIIVDKKSTAHYPALNYTSILNALGPTNWILLALKENEGYKHIEVPSPTTLTQINPEIVEPQTLVITEKAGSTIEFKTPSSTHTKFTHFKLNFNTNIGSNHGTLIHELFEKLPHQGVTEFMVKELQSDISDSDLSAVMHFYENEIYTKLSQGEIHHEYPFYALIDNEVLHGYMDMVSFTDEATYLVDYKTDRVDSSETLLELYSDQLLAYTKVLQQLRPDKAVKTYLYSLALKSFIPVI